MKLSLNGLIGYLQGKGWKVKLNEDAASEEETFEILEEEDTAPPIEEFPSDDPMLSTEELNALKTFATILAQNEQLLNGENLLNALKVVPAAAALVQNAQAREKTEKDALIATIKVNSSNVYSDEELETMSIPVLTKLNAQMNVNYLGLGGSTFANESESPLGIRPVLLAHTEED